jgi:hypothetical protein
MEHLVKIPAQLSNGKKRLRDATIRESKVV